MRNPSIWRAIELRKWDAFTKDERGNYIPARPLPWYGLRLFKNLKIAYYVFIGKYDALYWEDKK